jgi:putative endonuclease
MKRIAFGRFGEDIAEKFLKDKGIKIIDRNVRTPFGEIDIIGEENEKIYFVEVKTRSNTNFGLPIEAVNKRKKAHMVNSAMFYLRGREKDFEIGVISILFNGENFNVEYTTEIF